MSSRLRFGLAFALIAIAVASITTLYMHRSVAPPSFSRPAADNDVLPKIDPVEYARIAEGGKHYGPLRYVLDFPGVVDPKWKTMDEVELDGLTEVIGVMLHDRAFAFVLDSMLDPTKHVVNASVDGQAISATYCDKTQCVRVFRNTADDEGGPIPLHVGGLSAADEMVLMIDGERYNQASEHLPLQDHPFERTTLGEWEKKHPKSKVYYERDEL